MKHRRRTLIVAGQPIEIDAPGLDIREGGTRRAYWVCPKRGRRARFQPTVLRLYCDLDAAADVERMAAQCRQLYTEMLEWIASPDAQTRTVYAGTVGSLLDLWQKDELSPWHALSQNSQRSYEYAIRVLKAYGFTNRRVDRLTGQDLRRWHSTIMSPPDYAGKPMLRKADLAVRDLMRAALVYGMEVSLPACGPLLAVLSVMRFKAPKLTKDERAIVKKQKLPMEYRHAEAIVKLGIAKGEKKWRSIALGVAAQFEFTLRQIDVIGAWEPIKRFAPQGTIVAGRKWWRPGLRFEDIGALLELPTSKTDTDVVFDPNEYPLFQMALAAVPENERTGPLCVTNDDLPFQTRYYSDVFRQLATEAKVPDEIWNARARHGGLTEGYEAIVEKHGDGSAALDDLRFHGQHAHIETTFGHYIRSGAKATTRVARARVASRTKKDSA
jgi:hypothetical protein